MFQLSFFRMGPSAVRFGLWSEGLQLHSCMQNCGNVKGSSNPTIQVCFPSSNIWISCVILYCFGWKWLFGEM